MQQNSLLGQIKKTFLDKQNKSDYIKLQILYDLDFIGYYEYIGGRSTPLVLWSFREKTFAHMSLQVKRQSTCVIHSGLLKALNLERKVIFNP